MKTTQSPTPLTLTARLAAVDLSDTTHLHLQPVGKEEIPLRDGQTLDDWQRRLYHLRCNLMNEAVIKIKQIFNELKDLEKVREDIASCQEVGVASNPKRTAKIERELKELSPKQKEIKHLDEIFWNSVEFDFLDQHLENQYPSIREGYVVVLQRQVKKGKQHLLVDMAHFFSSMTGMSNNPRQPRN